MNARLKTLSAGLAGLVCLLVWTRAGAEVDFSAGIEIQSPTDFYDPLAPYGTWVMVPEYGRCWHPTHVDFGWRPYCNGHWEWTDCGWYWASDEPWAWACYHYGSWLDDPAYGWIWIPATQWAPAWVTWREGPEYIGWAPCGPRGAAISPSWFVFVDAHHFRDPLRRRDLIVNNTTILERTRVINNIRREDRDLDGVRRRVFVNTGPGVGPIERATGAHFTPRPIREVVQQTPVPERLRRERSTNLERERVRENPTAPALRQPTGTEQRRRYEQPFAPQTPEPRNNRVPNPRITPPPPDLRQNAPPPTGREEPRTYPSAPSRTAPPPFSSPPAVSPSRPPAQERTLPPTGRERGIDRSQPPGTQIRPVAPPGREVAPGGPPENRDRRYDQRDGNGNP